jgi:hypothetical protein
MAFSMPAFSTDTDFHDFSAQPSASNTGDVKRKPVEKEMTAGAKKLSKMSASESKGMQSISSFFGAKK